MEHWGNIKAYPFSLVNRKAHHKAKRGTHLFYLLALILVARKYTPLLLCSIPPSTK